MAILVNDILQITDVQRIFGQTALNVYYYRVDEKGADVSYADIAAAFLFHVVSAVQAVQHNATTHIGVQIKNLSNEVDIYDQAVSFAGTVAANGSTSYEAWGFRLVRSTAITRHGSKRVAGVPDTWIINNEVVGSAIPFLTAAAEAMGEPLIGEGSGTEAMSLRPVIVGRFPITNPQAGELNLTEINPVSMGTFVGPSSQNSRKVGRGV